MFFHSKRSDTKHKKFSIVNEIRRTAYKIRSCIVLKDAIAKTFVANEHHSFTFVFTSSVVVVDLPTHRILSFLFPAEADVLVPVFSQSTDVLVVVLKFPYNTSSTQCKNGSCCSYSEEKSPMVRFPDPPKTLKQFEE